MKSMIKDGVYVAVMVVMSFGESFGSDNPNQLQPGCYGNSGIYQYPAGSFGDSNVGYNLPPLPLAPQYQEQKFVLPSAPPAQVNSFPVLDSASMPNNFNVADQKPQEFSSQ